MFEQLFAEIVARCLEAGLVQGDNLSVDGSFVEANAGKQSRIPREQLAEAAQVNHIVRQHLVEFEQQNPIIVAAPFLDSHRSPREKSFNDRILALSAGLVDLPAHPP